MASASPQYTVVGFTPELDWRPLTFLKPIPANRVCSACGLVRKTTALLPCMHVMCECCYDQCAQEGCHVCPLDGNSFEAEDVDIRDFPVDELLKREVKCWNEGTGCEHTTAASEIAQHFQTECKRHSIRCQKCLSIVLCTDVCAHIRSASCNTSTPITSEREVQRSDVNGLEFLTSFKYTLERQADEITGYLRPMAVDISTHGDRLNEVSHGINTLRQELAVSTKETNECLTKTLLEMAAFNAQLEGCLTTSTDTANTFSTRLISIEKTLKKGLTRAKDSLLHLIDAIEDIKGETKKSDQKSVSCVDNVTPHRELYAAKCVFFVKGVQSLQDTATKKGWAAYDNEAVYLRGYCMSPGVILIKGVKEVTLSARYTLHKGDVDDAVQWPFQHKIRMRVIHPREDAHRVLEYEPLRGIAEERPITSSNRPRFSDNSFILKDLISEGYVETDQLKIKWQVLP